MTSSSFCFFSAISTSTGRTPSWNHSLAPISATTCNPTLTKSKSFSNVCFLYFLCELRSSFPSFKSQYTLHCTLSDRIKRLWWFFHGWSHCISTQTKWCRDLHTRLRRSAASLGCSMWFCSIRSCRFTFLRLFVWIIECELGHSSLPKPISEGERAVGSVFGVGSGNERSEWGVETECEEAAFRENHSYWFESRESHWIGDTQFFYETIPPSDLIVKSRKMGVDLAKTYGVLEDIVG